MEAIWDTGEKNKCNEGGGKWGLIHRVYINLGTGCGTTPAPPLQHVCIRKFFIGSDLLILKQKFFKYNKEHNVAKICPFKRIVKIFDFEDIFVHFVLFDII